MDHTDRFNLMRLILGQICLDLIRVRPTAPVAFDKFRLEPQLVCELFPKRGKMPRFKHQHTIAGRQRIDQCGLPRSGAGRGVDEYMLLGLEDRLQPLQGTQPDLTKTRSAVVYRLLSNRTEYSVRNSARPRYLQKMTAGFSHVCKVSRFNLDELGAFASGRSCVLS